MEKITKELKVGIAKDKAFRKFLNELNEWWPKEYTWSQDKLKEIRINGQKDGLCTEIGPYGFRCDWGRVTELTENEKIKLKWQISPKREPVPDPEKASDIEIGFKDNKGLTTVEFVHRNFENHGEGAEDYRNVMNGEQGWVYILNAYKKYCEM
ncbi:SRPBCC domain-containing protein [Tamlana sp. 2_MG-2023]|uniref:SRPBCC domain-containing protein n=1 Tax=unclassified Tamlana TaxID=2614803 RepID=UPI0026E365C2|nr:MULTISPECIES: SRPBCC domain-containing protein [unclassified Tamlana]MDO6761755.1 SRPBCC domain-containing protein [Tamlana sp. 2_MG-2023]MDO6792516.1 SRPBCC domain-containing protein [Tamlana sp. 1_MG-2023]